MRRTQPPFFVHPPAPPPYRFELVDIELDVPTPRNDRRIHVDIESFTAIESPIDGSKVTAGMLRQALQRIYACYGRVDNFDEAVAAITARIHKLEPEE